MNPAVGLAVTLRVRMSASDAYQSNGSVSPARVLELLADVATELMIRLDGDEGSLRGLQQVELLSPVFVGDFIEATGVVTAIGNTTRQIALEASKVVTYARGDDLPLTAADALASPILVCRAVGTAVVPRAQQRRPRLVLAALPPSRRDATRLPQGNVIVTPPPNFIITPPRQTPPEVMIAASIMGGGVTRAHTQFAPTTSKEVAAEARRCREAGASIVYLGVDDVTAETDELAARMGEIVEAIRAETDVVIVVSSVSAGPADVERRIALADCGADIVAMATGSFNFGDSFVETRRSLVREVAFCLRDKNVHTIVESYELGHLEEAMALGRERVIASPLRLQFVFGVPGAVGAHEDTIAFASARAPRNAVWFAAGVGRHQRRVTETALRLGGHVRLGIADNIYLRKGVLAEGSVPFIERSANFARSIGRQPVEPERAKVMLGLAPKKARGDVPKAEGESQKPGGTTADGSFDVLSAEPQAIEPEATSCAEAAEHGSEQSEGDKGHDR